MDVLLHPHVALKQRADDVDPALDSELSQLAKRMASAMFEAAGIGLAATQIGVLKRVVIYNLEDDLVALCNPVIVGHSDETELDEEGCLSLPGITVPVERFARVSCEALTLEGEKVRIDAEELHARLLQHEIDHLDGVLIIDRATPDERRAAIRRYVEASRTAG